MIHVKAEVSFAAQTHKIKAGEFMLLGDDELACPDSDILRRTFDPSSKQQFRR